MKEEKTEDVEGEEEDGVLDECSFWDGLHRRADCNRR